VILHLRDQCYDFGNILAEKIAIFNQITAFREDKITMTSVFKEKRQLFCRKLAKLAENSDQNIDARSIQGC
jgi:hypothetical protein